MTSIQLIPFDAALVDDIVTAKIHPKTDTNLKSSFFKSNSIHVCHRTYEKHATEIVLLVQVYLHIVLLVQIYLHIVCAKHGKSIKIIQN